MHKTGVPVAFIWEGVPNNNRAKPQKLLRALFVARKEYAYEQIKAFAESR